MINEHRLIFCTKVFYRHTSLSRHRIVNFDVNISSEMDSLYISIYKCAKLFCMYLRNNICVLVQCTRWRCNMSFLLHIHIFVYTYLYLRRSMPEILPIRRKTINYICICIKNSSFSYVRSLWINLCYSVLCSLTQCSNLMNCHAHLRVSYNLFCYVL